MVGLFYHSRRLIKNIPKKEVVSNGEKISKSTGFSPKSI